MQPGNSQPAPQLRHVEAMVTGGWVAIAGEGAGNDPGPMKNLSPPEKSRKILRLSETCCPHNHFQNTESVAAQRNSTLRGG